MTIMPRQSLIRDSKGSRVRVMIVELRAKAYRFSFEHDEIEKIEIQC